MKDNDNINDELEEISPFLKGLKKDLPYSAPPKGYFETLPSVLLDKAQKEDSDTNQSATPFFSSKVFRLSKFVAAALVTGLIAFSSIWFYQNKEQKAEANKSETSLNQLLTQISDEDLANYASQNYVLPSFIADKISVDSLAKKSKSPPIAGDDDLNSLISDYSTEELELYINENLLTESYLY